MKTTWQFAGVVALSCIAFAAPAGGQSDNCPVAGHYWLAGKAGANAYRGEATISAEGGGCFMKWAPPNYSEGSGTYENGVLTIHFRFTNGLNGNASGVVRYTRTANGEMQGVWWLDNAPNQRGIETLSPHGPPQI